VAPPVVDRLKAPIHTTVFRVEWSAVEWKAVDRLKGALAETEHTCRTVKGPNSGDEDEKGNILHKVTC
jgi:hypothetical protein